VLKYSHNVEIEVIMRLIALLLSIFSFLLAMLSVTLWGYSWTYQYIGEDIGGSAWLLKTFPDFSENLPDFAKQAFRIFFYGTIGIGISLICLAMASLALGIRHLVQNRRKKLKHLPVPVDDASNAGLKPNNLKIEWASVATAIAILLVALSKTKGVKKN
jgi:hypothetical protein